MRISIFGMGYVGVVSAGCLANDGHEVVGVDPNQVKVDLVNKGVTPIIEKDIGEMVEKADKQGSLRATTSVIEAVKATDVSLVCVGTPSQLNGNLDLSYVRRVCEEIGTALRDKASFHVVVARSTMLPGSMRNVVIPTLEQASGKKAGVDFGIAGDAETCCGGRAYQMGFTKEFLAQAKKNMALVKKAGVRTVVTACADGYQAFKVFYDKHGLKGDLEVLHITEYIDRLLSEGRLKLSKKVDMAVTYHDPCRLGRLGEPWIHWQGKKKPGDRFVFDPPKAYRRGSHGIYEPPRRVLRSIPGLKLAEMTRIKEYAWCCGAGGGVGESNPEFAAWTALKRLEEAKSTGAEAVVTACPWCEQTFKRAVEQSGSALTVYDIVELVERAIQ